jgi:type VI secretion system protein ImpH
MAAPRWAEDSHLKDTPLKIVLHEDACSFEFFQAVTLLQHLQRDRKPVGRFSKVEEEAVHFRANNTLAFPASQIQQIDYPDDAPPHMIVNFMGLTGPMGVLPYCYTELILERARAKDRTLPAFLDIFNHRMISFFYRAWEKHHFPVTYSLGDEDLFTHHLLDFIGLGTPGLQNRQAVPDDALMHFTGLLGMQSRSAAALEAILTDYFQIPVEIEQFSGAWYRLDPAIQTCMDDNDDLSQQLGQGAVVGDEIWNQRSRVRVKLGPLTLSQYRDFLPDGSGFESLRALTKFFSNDELDFEVQLLLSREQAPRCEIGSQGETAPRLGWISWLKSAPLNRDPGDTILHF